MSSPEEGVPKAEDPKGSGVAESTEMFASVSPENSGLLSRVSEAGKGIFREAYEKVVGTEVVGRLAVAYHGYFARRAENQALERREATQNLDLKIKALEKSKVDIAKLLGELDPNTVDSAKNLRTRAIDDQIRDLSAKRDRSQSALEAASNKAKIRTNERDQIAARLIGGYDERLQPLELELGVLEAQRNRTELLAEAMEARHGEELLRLKEQEAGHKRIVTNLLAAGFSERKIASMSEFANKGKEIAVGQERIRKEKAELHRRRRGIEKNIAEAEKKANPFRDKREVFVRIQQGRPMEVSIPARSQTRYSPRVERARVMPREELPETEEAPEEDIRVQQETRPERPGKYSIELLITEWNAVLGRDAKLKGGPAIIDKKAFLSETELKEDIPLSLESFRKIVGAYYKVHRTEVGELQNKFEGLAKRKNLKKLKNPNSNP
jgi:hypothetical protein